MPLPAAAIGPAIAAGASILGQAGTAFAQGKMNKKTRKWNEKMYSRQRADSLMDWTMQNEYNSPTSQMQRLREAGLNPALVYGNGATTESGPVRSSDTPSWNPRPAEFDGGAVSAAYFNTAVNQAQTDNLKTQNTVLAQEALLKSAQILATLASTEGTKQNTEASKFDLQMKRELKQTSMDMAKAVLDNTRATTKSTLDENERRAVMQTSNLREAVERVKNMRVQRLHEQEKMASTIVERDKIRQEIANLNQQMNLLIKEGRLKAIEIELRKTGIQPNDPLWARMIAKVFNIELGKAGKELPDTYNE